jgi:hypothetical protein
VKTAGFSEGTSHDVAQLFSIAFARRSSLESIPSAWANAIVGWLKPKGLLEQWSVALFADI